MGKKENYEDLLKEILDNLKKTGAKVHPSCNPQALEKCSNELESRLDITLPINYANFLRKANGLVWEDLVLCYVIDENSEDPDLKQSKPNEEIISINTTFHEKGLPENHLIIGYESDFLYTCDFPQSHCFILDEKKFEIVESFDSFVDLFHAVIEGVKE
jgi:hypothetical protein